MKEINENTKETIIEELEEAIDVVEYVFKKSVNFEGNDYNSITLNLEELTGKDVKDVSAELLAQGEVMGLAETNKNFLSALAARSANLPKEFMDYIPARDFSRITIEVQNFLLG